MVLTMKYFQIGYISMGKCFVFKNKSAIYNIFRVFGMLLFGSFVKNAYFCGLKIKETKI